MYVPNKQLLLLHLHYNSGVKIIGNDMPHQIASPVNLTCSSDLAVQTIRWLNNSDNGTELFNNSGQQQLLLPIERVTSSLASTMYTCEMQVMLATGVEVVREMIVFEVNGKLKTVDMCIQFTDLLVQMNLPLDLLILLWQL